MSGGGSTQTGDTSRQRLLVSAGVSTHQAASCLCFHSVCSQSIKSDTSIHHCSVMAPSYRFGLLWTQVELQDDLSGDGVALLRPLQGKETEGDLGLLLNVLHQPQWLERHLEHEALATHLLGQTLLIGDCQWLGEFLLRRSHVVGGELPEK